jgi:hypothetical protein
MRLSSWTSPRRDRREQYSYTLHNVYREGLSQGELELEASLTI